MTASDLLSAQFTLRAVPLDEDAFYQAYEQRSVLATPIHQSILSWAASFAVRSVTVLFASVARTR